MYIFQSNYPVYLLFDAHVELLIIIKMKNDTELKKQNLVFILKRFGRLFDIYYNFYSVS